MAWAEQRGKRWRGMYRDADGRSREAGRADGKKAAIILAQEEEAKIRAGTWHDPNAGKIKFSDYFENHWLPHRLQEKNTVAGYKSHYRSALKDAFGNVELRKISKPMIQRWVNGMTKAGVSAGTVRAKYRTLCTVLGAPTAS